MRWRACLPRQQAKQNDDTIKTVGISHSHVAIASSCLYTSERGDMHVFDVVPRRRMYSRASHAAAVCTIR